MKLKILFAVVITSFLIQPTFAVDKGIAKVGPVSLKSVSNDEGASSIAATLVADTYQITLRGAVGLSSGVVSIYLPADTVFSKGQEFDVTSSGNEVTDSANILFLVQKTQIKGSSAVITGYSTDNDSEATGKLKVIAYNSETKELKFTLSAKVAPYIRTVNLAAKTITQPIQVTANVVVTLP
ncbi:MAG: hypothetical protein ACKO3R_05360 [bacterium]